MTVVDEAGILKATWTDNGKKVEQIAFENKYTAEKAGTSSAKTGDSTGSASWLLLMILSGAGVYFVDKKRKTPF